MHGTASGWFLIWLPQGFLKAPILSTRMACS